MTTDKAQFAAWGAHQAQKAATPDNQEGEGTGELQEGDRCPE